MLWFVDTSVSLRKCVSDASDNNGRYGLGDESPDGSRNSSQYHLLEQKVVWWRI